MAEEKGTQNSQASPGSPPPEDASFSEYFAWHTQQRSPAGESPFDSAGQQAEEPPAGGEEGEPETDPPNTCLLYTSPSPRDS